MPLDSPLPPARSTGGPDPAADVNLLTTAIIQARTQFDAHANDTFLHPKELGYAEGGPSDFATASTAPIAVPGLSTTVTVGQRPVMVRAWIPAIKSSGLSDNIVVGVYEGDTAIQAAFIQTMVVDKNTVAFPIERRRDVPPGVYTYTVRVYRFSGTGTITVAANGSFNIVPTLHVYELAAT